MTASVSSLETCIAETFGRLGESCRRCQARCADHVRNAPIASVLWAAGIGYFLRLVPIGFLLGLTVRFIRALLKPALLVFAAINILDLLKRRAGSAPEAPTIPSPAAPGSSSPGPPPRVDVPKVGDPAWE